MLVPGDVFAWLRNEVGLDAGTPLRGGMVELPASATGAIMSGQIVAKSLAGHLPSLGGVAGSDVAAETRALKQIAAQRGHGLGSGNAPSERLYSWNMLSPVLARLRVSLSADDKTLIVAGDEDIVVNMLQELKSRIPAPKSIHGTDANNGAQVRHSVSHHGNEGRGRGDVRESHSSRRPITDNVGGAANVAGNGNRPWQGPGNNPGVDMRGLAPQQHAPTSGMYPHAQQYSDKPKAFSSYGMHAGHAALNPGNVARSVLYPYIAGGIPASHTNVHPSQNHRSSNPQNPSMPSGPTGAYSEAAKPLSSYAMNVGLAAPHATHYNHYEPNNGGYISYESKSGMPNSMAGGGGAGGGSSRPCARVLAEVLAGKLSISAAEAAAALTDSQQTLIKRFLAEGSRPDGEDHSGKAADKFLTALQEQLPPVLASVQSARAGAAADTALAEDLVLVLTTLHWALLSPVAPVFLCLLLVVFAAARTSMYRPKQRCTRK